MASGNLSVLTDENGRFEFTGVTAPGSAYLFAKKAGFLQRPEPDGQSGSRRVEIWAQDVEVNLALMPEAVVAGVVNNDSGSPVRKMSLSLMQRHIIGGLYEWDAIRKAATDDNGAYAIASLEPGTYILRTTTMPDADEIQRSGQTMGQGYSTTYYPSAANLEGAKPIAVTAGQHAVANFTLAKQKFMLVIVPYAAEPVEGAGSGGSSLIDNGGENYSILPEWDQDQHSFRILAPRGNYTFNFNLSPGMSINGLIPWKNGTSGNFYGTTEFTIADQPLTIPQVPMAQPASVTLRVRSEIVPEEWAKVATAKFGFAYPPTVHLKLVGANRNFGNEVNWSAKDPEKTLAFDNVIPGEYIVHADSTNGTYIASLTCGGIDLLRERLAVRPGVPSCLIEATLRDDIATVQLGLTAEGLAAMAAAGLTTATPRLIPLDNPLKPVPWTDIFFNASNSVRFAGVPPGTYLAILSNEGMPQISDPRIAYRDPDVLKQLMACGQQFKVAPGEQAKLLINWCSLR
jgi:hypothetical protein